MSSASESDATCLKVKDRESGATSDGGGVALSEVGGGKERKLVAGDSAVYNIHLSLPGVPQPVDVMVSATCPARTGSKSIGIGSKSMFVCVVDVAGHSP